MGLFSRPAQRAKIFWAIDPFHEKPREQLRAFEAITKLFGKRSFEVQPVSMLRLGRYNPDSSQLVAGWHGLALTAEKKIEKLLSNIKHPSLQRPRLIRQEGSSVTSAAAGLLKFALQDEAQMIVVTSHGRKGMERLVLGSFAENLVLHSPLPVLVVNPKSKAKSAQQLKRILFPTDFSDSSYEAFTKTVLLARSVRISVLLFHKVQYIYPDVAPAFFYPAVSAESLKAVRDSLREQADEWIEFGRKKGVRVKLHLDTKEGHPLDEIIRAAKRLGPSTFIAMASQTGKLGAILLGSLTRQVLRNAPCPVMVIHPNEEFVVKRFVDEARLYGYYYTASPLFF